MMDLDAEFDEINSVLATLASTQTTRTVPTKEQNTSSTNITKSLSSSSTTPLNTSTTIQPVKSSSSSNMLLHTSVSSSASSSLNSPPQETPISLTALDRRGTIDDDDFPAPTLDTRRKMERLPVIDLDLEEESIRISSPMKPSKVVHPAPVEPAPPVVAPVVSVPSNPLSTSTKTKTESQITSIEHQIDDIEALLGYSIPEASASASSSLNKPTRPQRAPPVIPAVIPDPEHEPVQSIVNEVPKKISAIGKVQSVDTLPLREEPVKPNQATALDMDLVVQALLATQAEVSTLKNTMQSTLRGGTLRPTSTSAPLTRNASHAIINDSPRANYDMDTLRRNAAQNPGLTPLPDAAKKALTKRKKKEENPSFVVKDAKHCEGYLLRWEREKREWKKRFMVLNDAVLNVYKKKGGKKIDSVPLFSILFKDYADEANCFEINSSGFSTIVCTASKREKENWKAEIVKQKTARREQRVKNVMMKESKQSINIEDYKRQQREKFEQEQRQAEEVARAKQRQQISGSPMAHMTNTELVDKIRTEEINYLEIQREIQQVNHRKDEAANREEYNVAAECKNQLRVLEGRREYSDELLAHYKRELADRSLPDSSSISTSTSGKSSKRRDLEAQLQDLLNRKNQAVQIEDFITANNLKQQILNVEQQLSVTPQ